MNFLRTHYRDICLGLALLAGVVFGCNRAQAQMPPVPTNTVRLFTGPRMPQPVATNVVFRWDQYTNVWIEITSSTNLAGTNWTPYTNLPISCTQFCAPITQPAQFFRYRVLILDMVTTN